MTLHAKAGATRADGTVGEERAPRSPEFLEAERWARRVRVCDARATAAGYALAGKYDEAQRWLHEARQLDERKKP